MRALVTGGTGFAGGAILKHLIAGGADVHALARDEAGRAALERAGARAFGGNLGDPASIARAAAGCDVVVHAAGSPSFRATPRVLGWLNVAGTENVLRAARHAGVRRVVHVSCADVTLTGAPRARWDEHKAPIGAPADAHARSKLEAEELVISLGDATLETTVLRPAFLWGAGDRTNLPALCREGLAGGIRLVGAGRNLMATTHVRNLADAAARAATIPAAKGAIYLVADSELTLQAEFFTALSEAARLPRPRPGGLPYPLALAAAVARSALGGGGLHPTEVRRRGASSSFEWRKAKGELGYESPVSHGEGMRELAAWVDAEGGPATIATLERPTPTEADVAAQIEAARAAAR